MVVDLIEVDSVELFFCKPWIGFDPSYDIYRYIATIYYATAPLPMALPFVTISIGLYYFDLPL